MQKIRVELVCDACGAEEKPAQRTLHFAFDDDIGKRRDYVVELCARHYAQFAVQVEPWIKMARADTSIATPSAGRKGQKRTASNGTNGDSSAREAAEQRAAIRTWAKDNGYAVASRGKLPAEVEEAYHGRFSVANPFG